MKLSQKQIERLSGDVEAEGLNLNQATALTSILAYEAIESRALLLEAHCALAELCNLKRHKDEKGKDADYEIRQPEAWKLAFQTEQKIRKVRREQDI